VVIPVEPLPRNARLAGAAGGILKEGEVVPLEALIIAELFKVFAAVISALAVEIIRRCFARKENRPQK